MSKVSHSTSHQREKHMTPADYKKTWSTGSTS